MQAMTIFTHSTGNGDFMSQVYSTPASIASLTSKRSTGARRAFTLTELLVVITIIVLMLSMGIPLFRFITGSHSVDAAVNQSKSMLARARSEAIGSGANVGVAFYYDVSARRYAMAMVSQSDPVNNPTNLDFTSDTDFQYLPPGVGAYVITNAVVTDATAGSLSRTQDGYLRMGVIMFDSRGRLANVPFSLGSSSTFANKVNEASGIPLAKGLYTQVGFVLFDLEPFLARGFSQTTDVSIDGGTYINGSTGDQARDAWLDSNANPYILDRYSGGLVESPNL